MELLYKHTLERKQREIDTLKKQNRQIMDMCIKANPTQVTTITANTVVVNINVFGFEHTNHIPAHVVHRILTDSDTMPAAADALGRVIYCDPSHPENRTCYMLNKREGQVMVRGNAGWVIKPKQVVFPHMHRAVTNIAFDKQPHELEQAEKAARILRDLHQAESDEEYPAAVYSAVLAAAKSMRGAPP